MTKQAFVIGDPIKHSRSPLIHGYWLKKYGIDAHYNAIHVQTDGLACFATRIRNGEFAGGNVTLPHKEAVFALADSVTDTAKAIGAANTLVWDEATKTLLADNTDAYGFTANLNAQAPHWRAGSTALVLGAGGAARAIVHALVTVGYRTILIANRTRAKADKLAEMAVDHCRSIEWDERHRNVENADIVINTTALGMTGQNELELSLQDAKSDLVVADIVYVPLETALLAQARARQLAAVDGLGMLLHQAVPGFEKWFGIRPEVDKGLRDMIVADLTGVKS